MAHTHKRNARLTGRPFFLRMRAIVVVWWSRVQSRELKRERDIRHMRHSFGWWWWGQRRQRRRYVDTHTHTQQ